MLLKNHKTTTRLLLATVCIMILLSAINTNVCAQETDSTQAHQESFRFTPTEDALFDIKLSKTSVYSDSLSFSKKHAIRFAIIPGPVVDPIGNQGVAVLPVVAYRINPNDSISPPSSTSALIYLTGSGSYIYGIQQSLFLKQDTWRFRFYAKKSSLYYDFFGIGLQPSDITSASQPYLILEEGNSYLLEGYRRIYKRLYTGLQLGYEEYSITADNIRDQDYLDSMKVTPEKQKYASILPTVFWDSRDNIYWTSKGCYAYLCVSNYILTQTGKQTHAKAIWFVNNYITLHQQAHKKIILATRIAGQQSNGDVAFPDLAYYGNGLDLRGYRTGKYVNYSLFACQAEVRMDVWKYINFAFFAGVGKSYKDLHTISKSEWLPATGAGVYVRLIAKYNIRANGFFAVGRESWNWYLGLSQSF